MGEQLVTYYLEMHAAGELNAKPARPELQIVECEVAQPALNRFLYDLVGSGWGWNELKIWSEDDWRQRVERDDHRTWVAYHRGAIAGYYELHRPDGENTEILYFGLAPQFLGMGFGGALLSHAIASAWGWAGTRRVWVHTCSLDHPSALANYQARGMRLFKKEVTPLA